MQQDVFQVQLKDFEGPLDLLLFLIQREEIDILDIPIAYILEKYLGFVRQMERVDLDGVADFLYIAALLIRVKVRILCPSPELEAEEEVIDPRQELVEKLLQYRRFKEAAEALEDRKMVRSSLFERGVVTEADDDKVMEVFGNTSLFHLVGALRRFLTKATEDVPMAIEAQNYTTEEQRQYVLGAMDIRNSVAFSELVRMQTKPFIIATFLAILELVQRGLIIVQTSGTLEDFTVARRTEDE